jgi:hypothetical protein
MAAKKSGSSPEAQHRSFVSTDLQTGKANGIRFFDIVTVEKDNKGEKAASGLDCNDSSLACLL